MFIRSASLLVLLGLSCAALADDDMERVTSSVCEYTRLDDRSSLRQKLDDSSVDLRRSYDELHCGSKSLLRVAAESGSIESATFIISKVGKRAITEQGSDGLTVLQWAQKRMESADAATKAKIGAVVSLMQSKL